MCAGLAKNFKMDSTIVRLILCFLAVLLGGVIAYIVLWIVLPETSVYGEVSVSEKADNDAITTEKDAKAKGSCYRTISIGALFLITTFIPRFNVLDLWPVVLIAVGILLLAKWQKH